jgi:uncharacterized OB-fold protein
MAVSDEELLERYPWGAIDHDNKEQWRGFLERRLLVDRCQDCGTWFDPPRSMCPRCWSERIEPQQVAGTGRVIYFTLLYQGHPAASPEHPFPAVVVELDEQAGLRFDSTVVECAPDVVQCDLALELCWIGDDAAPIPAFRPADPSLRTGT